MKAKLIIGTLLVCSTLPLFAQQPAQQVSQLQIPDAYTHSVDSLAFYIDMQCSTEEEKLEALYGWITSTMTYNVYPFFEKSQETDEEIVSRTLKTRDGVCRHFARVFRLAGERMDIPVYVVEGYVKSRSGSLMTSLHAWCVAKVGGKWYVYDPTFGMGSISNQKFKSNPTMKYCKMSPETAIQTYMPCDPIWQLLEYPVKYEEFDAGVQTLPTSGTAFNYNDSIRIYMQQTPLQQVLSVNRRMTANGRPNSLTNYYKQVNDANIQVYRDREIYDAFKVALKLNNRSIDILRDLDFYRRNHFKPKRNKAEVNDLMTEAHGSNNEAATAIASVEVAEASPYYKAVSNLRANIVDTREKLDLLATLLNN